MPTVIFNRQLFIFACGALLFSASALSLAAEPVTVSLEQFKVVKVKDGSEQFTAVSAIKPGDVIEYRVTYVNNTDGPVNDVMADLPIPSGMEYIPLSASSAANAREAVVKATTGNSVFAAEPLLRKGANGKSEPVSYSEYRGLRWSLGQLPAHLPKTVSARATVAWQ